MKTPFQGDCKIIPTDLPESFKLELLQASSPRYIWIFLPEPIRQIGHDFLFLVLPIKLTSELELRQCGPGVLCQAEAEMKESLELLANMAQEYIVSFQSAGFGSVGKVKKFRSVITEQSARFRPGKNGKDRWFVLEREIDRATGEVTVLRRQDAANEMEAVRTIEKWRREYEQRKKRGDAGCADLSHIPSPPSRCKPLTPVELNKDLPVAKWTALKRRWPHTFQIFEKQRLNPGAKVSHQQCQDSYLLDLVEQGYDPKTEIIRGDLELAGALTKAAKKFARGSKRPITDAAIYLIAFNYELGWCYLSDAEIARKLGEILETSFTPEQVEKYRYRTLGLVGKHMSGPAPKYP